MVSPAWEREHQATSSGSPGRRLASGRRWPATARGPTPRSSACRGAQHPDFETVLLRPHRHGLLGHGRRAPRRERLATFHGERALFIHNASYYWGRGVHGRGRPRHPRQRVHGQLRGRRSRSATSSSAPRVPAVDAGVDVGLVQMSSASARIVYPGYAIYGASKAAIEQWVRCVRAEREDRGRGPWVVAIRPGFVDTPGRSARSRVAARHPSRRARHRRGSTDRQHARGRRVGRTHLGRLIPDEPRPSPCCSSASPSASPHDDGSRCAPGRGLVDGMDREHRHRRRAPPRRHGARRRVGALAGEGR